MQDKKWRWVMLAALIAISANFWNFPVYILDEAKNTACAMEMLQRGDWVVPTFNGQLRTDKPPLHYYFMMASYALFGITPFAARLWSVIMGLMTVACVYFFVKRMEGERMAFFSGLAMASSLFITIEFHLAVPDPYFIFFLTYCWLSFAYGISSARTGWLYSGYAALALAFMAKGPVALALTVPILFLFVILREGFTWSIFLRVRMLQGIGLFILITAPWWIIVTLKTDGAWLSSFIFEHNVGRFTSAYEDHGGAPGVAILVFLVALLPLSVLIPRGLYLGWKQRSRPLVLLSVLAIVTVLAFFTVSRTFLPNYVGPAIPFGAILIGFAVDAWILQGAITRFQRWAAIISTILLVLLVPVLFVVVANDRWIHELPWIAWLFLPWPAAGLAGCWFLFSNNIQKAVISWFAGFWLTGVLLFYAAVPKIMDQNPVFGSLPMVRGTDRVLLGYRFFNPAYIFSIQRTLPTFWTPSDILRYSEGKRVMVLSRSDYEQELLDAGFRVVYRHPYLFEGPTALILVNDGDQ